LLASGVAIETIAGILGQASLDTTRIYTKVDINALREAALEVDGGWK
jgi:site-specific recombinase XerD